MVSLRHFLIPTLLLSSAVLTTGCGVGVPAPSVVAQDNASGAFSGNVIGGQNPISGATISVYSYGTNGYGSNAKKLASTTTDASGSFNFASGAYTCPTGNTPVYLLSVGGDAGSGANPNAVLGAVLGTCTHAKSSFLILNEISTVGLAYALSGYFNTTIGGTAPAHDSFGGPKGSLGLANANNTTANLIAQLTTGYAQPSSGNLTTEATKVYTIGNILGACINSSGQTSSTDTTSACGRLFSYTTPPGSSTRPSDTLQAAVQMALYPTQNVNNLFLIPGSRVPFASDLSAPPADWSLAVSFTGSGLGLGIDTNTLSSIDIDATGRVWFASNVSGGVGVAFFDPTSQSFNGPYNGTTMVHPEQVSIDGSNYIWLNDTQGPQASGYSTSAPGNYSSPIFSLGSYSTAVAVNADNSIKMGLFDNVSGRYELGDVSANRHTYTAEATPLLAGSSVVSIANDTSSDSFLALSSNSTTSFSHYYQTDGTTTVTAQDAASDATGLTAYNGSDLIGVSSYSTATGSAGDGDGICFYDASACYPIAGTSKHGVTGIAVDGAKTVWLASGLDATVQAAPMTSASGSGLAADYTGSNQQITTTTYTHNNSNGGTLVAPAGIAIDNSGNVWVSNAGCLGTGCTPSTFVLTEIIGAAVPTVTPISGQLFNGESGQEP